MLALRRPARRPAQRQSPARRPARRPALRPAKMDVVQLKWTLLAHVVWRREGRHVVEVVDDLEVVWFGSRRLVRWLT